MALRLQSHDLLSCLRRLRASPWMSLYSFYSYCFLVASGVWKSFHHHLIPYLVCTFSYVPKPVFSSPPLVCLGIETFLSHHFLHKVCDAYIPCLRIPMMLVSEDIAYFLAVVCGFCHVLVAQTSIVSIFLICFRISGCGGCVLYYVHLCILRFAYVSLLSLDTHMWDSLSRSFCRTSVVLLLQLWRLPWLLRFGVVAELRMRTLLFPIVLLRLAILL